MSTNWDINCLKNVTKAYLTNLFFVYAATTECQEITFCWLGLFLLLLSLHSTDDQTRIIFARIVYTKNKKATSNKFLVGGKIFVFSLSFFSFHCSSKTLLKDDFENWRRDQQKVFNFVGWKLFCLVLLFFCHVVNFFNEKVDSHFFSLSFFLTKKRFWPNLKKLDETKETTSRGSAPKEESMMTTWVSLTSL